MMNSNNVKRAFKGVMLNFYFDFRKYLLAGAVIILITTLFDFVATIINSRIRDISGENVSGIFIVGFIVMIVALCMFTLQSSSSGGIKKKFMFPINRLTYAAANLISIILGSLAMLMVITMIAPIEILLFKVASLFSEKIIYISALTISNFITGFISSWAYMVVAASILHLILIFLKRYKVSSLIVLVTIVITLFISLNNNRSLFEFIFGENNFSMLMLKLTVISISCHLLAFIPTKNLEVI